MAHVIFIEHMQKTHKTHKKNAVIKAIGSNNCISNSSNSTLGKSIPIIVTNL